MNARFFEFIKKHLPILTIFFLSLLIRILFPTFGSPALYTIPDEVPNYLASFEMIALRTIHTSSQYPPLGSYVLVPFYLLGYLYMKLSGSVQSVEEFKLFLLTHEGFLLFIPRLISAVFGSASIVIVYATAKLLTSRTAANWAAILSAFSLTHLQMSHIGKPWMPSQFFSLLAIYFIIRYIYLVKDSSKYIFYGAVSFAISIGFHFSALYAVLYALLTSIYYLFRRHVLAQSTSSLSILGFIPFFSLLLYRALMTYEYKASEFSGILLYNVEQGLVKGVFHYIKEFAFSEPLLFISFILSIFLFKKWPILFKSYFIYIVVYFLFISLTFYQSLRYLLPVIPFIAIIGGFALSYYLRTINNSIYKNMLVIGLSWTLVFPCFLWLSKFAEIPTFIQLQRWVNVKIASEELVASTAIRFSPFVPNKEAIERMQLHQPRAWQQLSFYNPTHQYPETVRDITYLDVTGHVQSIKEIITYMQTYNIKILVQSYWDPDDRISNNSSEFRLIQHFNPTNHLSPVPLANLLHGSVNIIELMRVERFGPFIDVLEFSTLL